MAEDRAPSFAELADLLRAEHELLGAAFVRSDLRDFEYVARYQELEPEVDAFTSGAALADLTGLASILVSGQPAEALATMAFAGRKLGVGEVSFEGVISGDGSLLGAPLLARTGDREFVALELSDRAETVYSWLGFLAAIQQGDQAPFSGVETTDMSTRLVPLLMAGPGAPTVLLDYIHQGTLPDAGQATTLMLDSIHCLAIGLPVQTSAWLMLVPPQAARILWRSFLSFPIVTPVGRQAVDAWLERELAWYALVRGTDRIELPARELRSYGLVRSGSDFVGARSLAR